MPWLSLAFALAAVPTAFFDRRSALVLVSGAVLTGTLARHRGRRPRLTRAALSLTVVAALVSAGLIVEFHRPVAPTGPDPRPFTRAGVEREVWLPLTVRTAPITKLALIEFAPDADPIYKSLEPQYLDDGTKRGWRILAYRNDGRVDVYDEPGLDRPDDTFDVIGAGLHQHVERPISVPAIDRDDAGRARISASFDDLEGRRIVIDIAETTTRRSTPTNILAPIGATAEHPTSFPLFVLHDFEFLRLCGSRLSVTIDGRTIDIAGFPIPIPMQGQPRSLAKYAPRTDIIELFPTDAAPRRVRTEPGSDRVTEGDVQYLFAGDAVERIGAKGSEVAFDPALDVTRPGSGRMTITPPDGFGHMAGNYRVTAEGSRTILEVEIDEVVVPRQRDVLYRALVNQRTFFGTWPKAYRYRAVIDPAAGSVEGTWVNAT